MIMQTIHYYIIDTNVVKNQVQTNEKIEKNKEIVQILLKMYLRDIDKKEKKSQTRDQADLPKKCQERKRRQYEKKEL